VVARPVGAITLARDGKPTATIVVAKEASRSAQTAAYELQYHVRRITGAELPIVTDETSPKGNLVAVGDSRLSHKLGYRADEFAPQEYAIRFSSHALVLIGRDMEEHEKVNYADPEGETFPGFFDDQGTCYAVYDFLERHCGVRWYLPTELGLICPSRKTLSVSGPSIRRSPGLKYRDISGTRPRADMLSWSSDNPSLLSGRDTKLWWLRLRAGGERYSANHSFYGWYERFGKTHPEYFAQGYEGTPPQLCYTNPAVVRQVVQDARGYFDGKGAPPGAVTRGDTFALVPMDNNQWCKCPRCQAELDPGNDYFSNGRASNYIWGFVNRVAREVRKTHPDKQISALAYYEYAYRPTRVKLEPNIAVQLCLHVKNWWSPGMEENDTGILKAWSESGDKRPLYLWLYYCFPFETGLVNGWTAFPGFAMHTLARQVGLFRQAGIRGAFLNEYPTSALNHLEHYLTFRLYFDPDLKADRLLDEFFTRYYGHAARPMRDFILKAEKLFSSPASYPQEIRTERKHRHMTEELSWKVLCPPERLEEFRALLRRAQSLAATPEEKARVDLFDRGVFQPMEAGSRHYLAEQAAKP
jgi:hypothetical protein